MGKLTEITEFDLESGIEWIMPRELAIMLNVGMDRIYKFTSNVRRERPDLFDGIEVYKLGGRLYFDEAQVDQWKKDQRVRGPKRRLMSSPTQPSQPEKASFKFAPYDECEIDWDWELHMSVYQSTRVFHGTCATDR